MVILALPIAMMFTIELRMMFIYFEHIVQSSCNMGFFWCLFFQLHGQLWVLDLDQKLSHLRLAIAMNHEDC